MFTAIHIAAGLSPRARPRVVRGGFTLLELVMTMAIVAVLAAIALPRYGFAVDRYRVQHAAQRLELDIESVRARARAIGAPLTITFQTTVGAAGYTVVGMPDPDDAASWYHVDLSAVPYTVDIKTVNFEGSPQLVVNGHGLPTAGGAVTLVAGEHEEVVTVASVTSNDPVD